ncbi:MAG: TetR/AcrR family transcriptional regulator [Sandaracinaceae bacterium]|jgi:AcrR family transcriptional regulator|nr:TetR/AcrR family transcriptional regulator [Sandaracinaceae bacterium]
MSTPVSARSRDEGLEVRSKDSPRDGRASRAEKIREQRRRELLDVALKVFAQRGYHQARIADIIDAAGVARGTFYLYFESKNAIFHALLDDLLARVRTSVVGVSMAGNAPPVNVQIRQSVERVLAAFVASPDLTRVVLREAVGLDAEVDKKLFDFYARLHRWLADALANGARLGLLRVSNGDLAAWAVLGTIKQMVQLLVDGPADSGRKPTITEAAEAILDYSLLGLAPR